MKISGFILFLGLHCIAALNSATLSNIFSQLLIQMDKPSRISIMVCWYAGKSTKMFSIVIFKLIIILYLETSFQIMKKLNSFGYFVKVTEPSILNFPKESEHQNVIIVDLNCKETNQLFIEVI